MKADMKSGNEIRLENDIAKYPVRYNEAVDAIETLIRWFLERAYKQAEHDDYTQYLIQLAYQRVDCLTITRIEK